MKTMHGEKLKPIASAFSPRFRQWSRCPCPTYGNTVFQKAPAVLKHVSRCAKKRKRQYPDTRHPIHQLLA
ncbi:predicted protein [Plenodomus lingam JN3]|uniref:Predicted protein n=1 Tax=Leptosphaeria maculans (strain JN3 / isolate v23.1.3 / race Av1-4-5-6-7-8) TaxID=985895 RepID=E4ZME0_LEPMJ|nr:predicted protein [Plenodomus lingam JN3]CBX92489.1 predicted protein [Plenodomus lingam JN3]